MKFIDAITTDADNIIYSRGDNRDSSSATLTNTLTFSYQLSVSNIDTVITYRFADNSNQTKFEYNNYLLIYYNIWLVTHFFFQ